MPGVTTLLGLLLALAPAAAPDDAALADRAAAAFHQGCACRDRALEAQARFRESASLYEQLRQRGVRNPALYRNLGNAEYLAGRPERALWAYRSGLLLAPNDRALREGLALARARVTYPADGSLIRAVESWPAWLPRPSPGSLFAVVGASYVLACLFVTLWLWRRGATILIGAGAAVVLLFVSLFGLWNSARAAEDDRRHPPVVIVTETSLYRGNAASYPTDPDVPTLPRGLEARLLGRRGGWLRVQLAGGPSGWVPETAALVVGDDGAAEAR